MSPDFLRRIDALRAELLEALGGRATGYYFRFTEEQVLDMASGYVPDTIKAAMLAAIDWRQEDERRAGRPATKRKKR